MGEIDGQLKRGALSIWKTQLLEHGEVTYGDVGDALCEKLLGDGRYEGIAAADLSDVAYEAAIATEAEARAWASELG